MKNNSSNRGATTAMTEMTTAGDETPAASGIFRGGEIVEEIEEEGEIEDNIC